MSGSPTWFCLQSDSLPVLPLPWEQWPQPLLAPSPPTLCSKGSIHARTWPWLQLQLALPRPQLPAPLCTPKQDLPDFPPARQGGLLKQGRSCCTDDPPTEQCLEDSAAQVFITAKPCILRSTGRRMCLPKSRWWMGPREGLCAASLWLRSITGAAGKHRELGWGSGFGLVGAALGVSGSKKHHTNILGFCSCSLFLTAAMLSKSKSKGELWLHPYLWQSHVLSLTPPREAWHHCLPVQLEGLSLTGCAPRGCYVGASPMPEHQAKAAGLERDHPAPSEGVCRQDQRPQEGHLTRGLWQVTASKCSRWPAQAVKHRLPSPGVSQSAWQCRAWDEGWDVLCPQPSHHGKRLARAGADNSPNQRCCNSTGTSTGCCCHNRASP